MKVLKQGNEVGKKEVEIEKRGSPPPPSPAKVEIMVEAIGGSLIYTDALHAQLLHFEKANIEEKLPRILIKAAEDDEISLEVIVIVSFADSSGKLIHSANFILEAVETTTLMEVKKGISKMLDVDYEDMGIVCGQKFLSDCRPLCYYDIFDGATVHLLVDSPDEIFKHVFPALVKLGHNEAVAAIATRSFVAKMTAKYNLDEGDNPILTQERIMIELGLFHVPNGYDSDDSDISDTSDEYDSDDSDEENDEDEENNEVEENDEDADNDEDEENDEVEGNGDNEENDEDDEDDDYDLNEDYDEIDDYDENEDNAENDEYDELEDPAFRFGEIEVIMVQEENLIIANNLLNYENFMNQNEDENDDAYLLDDENIVDDYTDSSDEDISSDYDSYCL